MVGWKDILRPIRDGLRDQLPPRVPEEDDKERERRRLNRESDALRGFTYLETFDELKSWSPDDAHQLQRANTPLLPRSQCTQESEGSKARVVLIHDYAGNYHEYEACQGSTVEKRSYSCEYMQFVDTFVYFSHKLVCIPPPSWTNPLHRNGVRSLGTFLVEPQSPGIGNILERRASPETNGGWEYPLASQLAKMTEVYGFDGWLLNIEKTFPYMQWSVEKMVGFIEQLRGHVGHGNVIWYDALTTNNTLHYQNSLTSRNLAFAQAAGVILTNYAWTPDKAMAAKNLALLHGFDPKDLVFGIDVWAQNTQNKDNPRTTYGGGGTGTGVAVTELARLGLSAGVFAPAWSFEHFPNCFAAVEHSMWDGCQLPPQLDCDCVSRDQHDAPGYRTDPIKQSSHEFMAGSESFFYTDFKGAFGQTLNTGAIPSHIGSQSVLPHLTSNSPQAKEGWQITGSLACDPSRLLISTILQASRDCSAGYLDLFRLSMYGCLEVTVAYRKNKTPKELSMTLELTGTQSQIDIPSAGCSYAKVSKRLDFGEESNGVTSSSRLTGIRLRLEGVPSKVSNGSTAIEILEICIKRQGAEHPKCTIEDLYLKSYGSQGNKLTWSLKKTEDETVMVGTGLPHSKITGGVSHFRIHMDGGLIGQAYCLEYILSAEQMSRLRDDKEHTIELEGIGFDGTLVCTFACSNRDVGHIEDGEESSRSSWQMV